MILHCQEGQQLTNSEQKVIEFIGDPKISQNNGYKISGHCGVAAYMILAALQLLEKKNYEGKTFSKMVNKTSAEKTGGLLIFT